MNKYLLWIGVVLFGCWFNVINASPWGLDQRPENLTCVAPDRPPTTLDITSQRVFENLPFADLNPISMSQPPGDPSRWFVAGRLGKIFSFANDSAVTNKQLVLDITDRMQFTDTVNLNADSQQSGITSFALHPQFAVHPYMYVAYNAKPGIVDPVYSFVSRFTSTDGGQTFDSFSEQVVISVAQPDTPFHHVGQIIFGPDGYLYIGLGDGGPPENAQNLNELRGSILRIDINQGSPYTVPPDNPLVGTGFREEIYAWGLRNPWRFTFDRETGGLWAGDVGGARWEEVNRIDRGGNYGWPVLQGTQCNWILNCDSTGMIPPVLEIEHPTAHAIIGGYVYRGSQIPSLQGVYIFGDAVNSNIQGLFYDAPGQAFSKLIAESLERVSAFAEALNGEVYFFQFRSSSAAMYKLVAAGSPPPDSSFPELLSETGCVDPFNPTIPANGLVPYTVNAPLWSDGAEKNRWIALPDGETIGVGPDGDFDFPIGTVLIKMFSFNGIPVETRLFVRHNDGGWGGYSYEWKDDLSDAVLLPAGKTKQITPEITWKFPSRNECFRCHTDVAGFALGPEIAQLNGSFVYPSTLIEANQLNTLDHIGLFTNGLSDQLSNLPALVAPSTSGAPVGRKARSYLHSNCSGCHRPGGPVQSNADFRFSTPVEAMSVCDVPPNLGDLGVTGAELLTPGDPLNSIISLRVHSLDINRMPPLGTVVVDTDGTGVIDTWISQADVCVVYPDTDADLVRDNVDNCTVHSNSSQFDTDGDGYGNICDPDFDNNLIVNADDLAYLKSVFFTTDPHADLDGSGVVNAGDLAILKSFFFDAPGPSGLVP